MIYIREFFSSDCPQGPFKLFSTAHIAAVAFVLLLCILLYKFRNKIRTQGLDQLVRSVFAVLLVLGEAGFQIWNIAIGEWSIKFTLPLQLCSISALMSIVMLLSKSYKIFEYVYFWGIGGAVQALLTPEIGVYTFPHFRYFQFFMSHGFIILSCFFMVFVEGYKPTLKSLWKAVFVLNIYAAFVGIINYMLDANYMFLCYKPQVESMLDFLGPWPWYLVSLEGAAIIIFYILYLPFKASRRKRYTSVNRNYFNS